MVAFWVIPSIFAYVAMGFLCIMICVKGHMLDPHDTADVECMPLIGFLWPIFLPISIIYIISRGFLEYLKDMNDRYDE